MPRSPLALAAALLLATAPGCAARRSSQPAPGRNDAVLTAEEIASVGGVTTLYDVIRLRRPRWLQPPRPTSVRRELQADIVIYMDNVRFGGPQVLREIHPSAARQVQYLGPSQAEARFGVGHPNGAILVLTRPGP